MHMWNNYIIISAAFFLNCILCTYFIAVRCFSTTWFFNERLVFHCIFTHTMKYSLDRHLIYFCISNDTVIDHSVMNILIIPSSCTLIFFQVFPRRGIDKSDCLHSCKTFYGYHLLSSIRGVWVSLLDWGLVSTWILCYLKQCIG